MIYITHKKNYTEKEIEKEYSKSISNKNYNTLVENLTDSDKSSNILLFTEIDGILYFSNTMNGALIPAQFYNM